MKNNHLFPFERNRYYAGKLLTSADFEAEQFYMNNKRRFLNQMMFGNGIICGLNVMNLDDLSVLVESGVAIDSAGREIVVASTVIKRLSGLAGFDCLNSDCAELFLRYKEENVHPVYCGDMGTEGKEYETNRIDEGYELYLQDVSSFDNASMTENELIMNEKILDTADYTVSVHMPYIVSMGHAVKVTVNVHKNSSQKKDIFFQAKLQFPAFTDGNGQHGIEIKIDNLILAKDQEVQKEYWLNVDYTEAAETNIIARKEDMEMRIGGDELEPGSGLNFKVLLSQQSPYELAVEETGRANLEQREYRNDDRGVCLAQIKLLRTEISCLIGDIREKGVKRYIVTPGMAGERQGFLSYFRSNNTIQQTDIQEEHTAEVPHKSDSAIPFLMASGRLEISLDVNMKKGDICYSEEIMHGLGKGNVYVEAGVEYIDDSSYKNGSRRSTVYGNPMLFPIQECMEIETAVRVMNDRGSFQVAAKLLGEQKSVVIQMNWVAVKFSSVKDAAQMQEERGRSITAQTPTIRLKAKDSYYFNVRFNNMEPCRLSYELTETGSGELGADGLYTAPAKEGVYEIYIYCTDMPKISTYAYAVVSKS